MDETTLGNPLFIPFRCKIDHRRMRIPKRFWGLCNNPDLLTRGFESELVFFTGKAFNAVVQYLNKLDMSKSSVRQFRRDFLVSACFIDVDNQGRLIIPNYLFQPFGFGIEAVCVPFGCFIEIWTPDSWEANSKPSAADRGRPFRDLLNRLIPWERRWEFGYTDTQGLLPKKERGSGLLIKETQATKSAIGVDDPKVDWKQWYQGLYYKMRRKRISEA